MDYFQNLELVRQISQEMIKPRSYAYSEELVADYLKQYKTIEYKQLKITNAHNEALKASLFVHAQSEEICIIFMHGLGSTRLEGLNLIKQLPIGYSLCVFDFSGSGKSEGQIVTYGCKQKDDIEAVLHHLRNQHNFNKFVLWGRSMGAVSALLHAISYQPSDVCLLVLDSPFSSFEAVTRELAEKKVKAPGFVVSLLLDLVKANFKKMKYDPFQIDVSENCGDCHVPALFVYSESDEVVKSEHSHRIIANFKAKYERHIIKEGHNAPRSKESLRRIYNTIDSYRYPVGRGLFAADAANPRQSIFDRKSRGINVYSKEKSQHKASAHSGISSSQNMNFAGQMLRSKKLEPPPNQAQKPQTQKTRCSSSIYSRHQQEDRHADAGLQKQTILNLHNGVTLSAHMSQHCSKHKIRINNPLVPSVRESQHQKDSPIKDDIVTTSGEYLYYTRNRRPEFASQQTIGYPEKKCSITSYSSTVLRSTSQAGRALRSSHGSEAYNSITTSPRKSSTPIGMYYGFEDELAFNISEQIGKKMLSNQRYL